MPFVDLFAFAAVCAMLRYVSDREKRADIGFLAVSVLFAAAFIVADSFRQYNSAEFLHGNAMRTLRSLLYILWYSIVIYGALRLASYKLEESPVERDAATSGKSPAGMFLRKHFSKIGFCVIAAGWLPWILMNYPGSGCPDSLLQLQEFFGIAEWGAGHPPLSTILMGSLFSAGRWIKDANFGFFLYCLFQTAVGALVFSAAMKKLLLFGIPLAWCMAGIAYYAFTPLWGVYAQWMEKDLLFAEVSLWQILCMMEVLIKESRGQNSAKQAKSGRDGRMQEESGKRGAGGKDIALLTISSLLTVFLRNNGIYAVLPALLVLALRLKGRMRKKTAYLSLFVLLVYEGATRMAYPALGIQEISAAESLSIPFQQTARYVCTYDGEVTEREKEVIDKLFGYENMFAYDPVISDPVKIHFKGGDMTEYFAVWGEMFCKHPGVYAAAFLNKSYGYIAPVSQNIEAWVQQKYYGGMEELGLSHAFDRRFSDILVRIWNGSMTLPLVKYLCTPGFYTWITAGLAFLLAKRKKHDALILFVPCLMNILVCLASPLADAIRYELPTVAAVPLLIGWSVFVLKGKK